MNEALRAALKRAAEMLRSPFVIVGGLIAIAAVVVTYLLR